MVGRVCKKHFFINFGNYPGNVGIFNLDGMSIFSSLISNFRYNMKYFLTPKFGLRIAHISIL